MTLWINSMFLWYLYYLTLYIVTTDLLWHFEDGRMSVGGFGCELCKFVS